LGVRDPISASLLIVKVFRVSSFIITVGVLWRLPI
jgi:hypothetical protein